MDLNKDDFDRFVRDNMNYKEKMHDLVKEAKNSTFFMIMALAKYNSVLDAALKEFDALDGDLLAQMLMYESLREGLEPMIEQIKKIGKDIKL